MNKRSVSVVFEDDRGYYLLEGDKPRKRVDVQAEEVFIQTDEWGVFVPSENGPPCLCCPESYANTFLDELEQEQEQQFMITIHSLLTRGYIAMAAPTPEGEECYRITRKGQVYKTIEHLGALLEKAEQESRDFTDTEWAALHLFTHELEKGVRKIDDLSIRLGE